MTPEWNEWKGEVNVKIENVTERFESVEHRMQKLEDKVGEIVARLSVPVFLSAAAGPIIGAIIVWAITKGTK